MKISAIWILNELDRKASKRLHFFDITIDFHSTFLRFKEAKGLAGIGTYFRSSFRELSFKMTHFFRVVVGLFAAESDVVSLL